MSVPIVVGVPGASVAPSSRNVDGRVPVPPSVAPGLTNTVPAEASEPLTSSVPPLTLTSPPKVAAPVSVHTELSILLKVPKLRYCAVSPSAEMSNVPAPLPPSWKMLPPAVDCTSPLITEPGASVRVLLPPKNWIAAMLPAIVPVLVMSEKFAPA